MPSPIDRLRHHVTGAIERGEKTPIVEVPAGHVVTPMTRYGPNTLAAIDSFGGLVKCRVIAINRPCNGRTIGTEGEITVRILENKGGYSKGEILGRIAAYTPPLRQLKKNAFSTTILTNYQYAN